MAGNVALFRNLFTEQPQILFQSEHFTATGFKYASGIEAVKIENSRGYLVVLPFYGQMIWDAVFDGHDLKMQNMFSEPKLGQDITDTYGCFAFHSGLRRNGCPAPDDDHPLHGEMPCARMDKAWLVLDGDTLAVAGSYEYVKGFGDHYRADPSVKLAAGSARFKLRMQVTNLASVPMPLQYMCHMNYAYVPNATFSQNVPATALTLRSSIPGHVHPTPQWLDYTRQLANSPDGLTQLNQPKCYDPEIVFFADDLSQYQDNAAFYMHCPDGVVFFTRFSTQELNYGTRWVLYNGDQKVAAFILPATCRPEGYNAACANGSLIMLAAGESRAFNVETGISN